MRVILPLIDDDALDLAETAEQGDGAMLMGVFAAAVKTVEEDTAGEENALNVLNRLRNAFRKTLRECGEQGWDWEASGIRFTL